MLLSLRLVKYYLVRKDHLKHWSTVDAFSGVRGTLFQLFLQISSDCLGQSVNPDLCIKRACITTSSLCSCSPAGLSKKHEQKLGIWNVDAENDLWVFLFLFGYPSQHSTASLLVNVFLLLFFFYCCVKLARFLKFNQNLKICHPVCLRLLESWVKFRQSIKHLMMQNSAKQLK